MRTRLRQRPWTKPNRRMSRRGFLQTAAAVGTASAAFAPAIFGEEKAGGVKWPIGCFNRPWSGNKKDWSYDAALDGIKAAGYGLTGLLTRSVKEPFIGSEATPEYLAGLKQRIAARGLKANLASLRVKSELPLPDQIADLRRQIDNGKTFGLEFLMTFGANRTEDFEDFYKVMADAAAYAQERGLELVLKPHGGASGAAEEILRCLDRVKHPNFKIWFDAGNIIFYTGKDPVKELKPIAQHVTGFCAKDCAEPRGPVSLQFGTGKVDFRAVFAELKRAGFHGPVMVECCAPGDTPQAVTENARQNREFLEKLFAGL